VGLPGAGRMVSVEPGFLWQEVADPGILAQILGSAERLV
jgi:hypothetical protein